jgi:hypothetical protein
VLVVVSDGFLTMGYITKFENYYLNVMDVFFLPLICLYDEVFMFFLEYHSRSKCGLSGKSKSRAK